MVWIFAAVVLILMVTHPGFRKVAFWIAGTATAFMVIAVVVSMTHTSNPPPVTAAAAQSSFDPDAYLTQGSTGDRDADAVIRGMPK